MRLQALYYKGKEYRVSLKKRSFKGFDTPGDLVTISKAADQSKTLSNTLFWVDALILYVIAQFYTSENTWKALQ